MKVRNKEERGFETGNVKESPHKGFRVEGAGEEEGEEEEGKGEEKGASSGEENGARFVFCFLCSRERVTEKVEDFCLTNCSILNPPKKKNKQQSSKNKNEKTQTNKTDMKTPGTGCSSPFLLEHV